MSHKLVCNSIEQKDPGYLTRSLATLTLTADSYLGEISSSTFTDKKHNIEKTTYHSQVFVKGTNANLVVPIFQVTPSAAATQHEFGKLVLKIKHHNNNNSSKTQLFEVVGTQQSATEAGTTDLLTTSGLLTTSTSQTTMTANTIGTAANLYSTGVYIAGEDASSAIVKKTYEIDLNTYLTSDDADKLICWGLKFNQEPVTANSIFSIEAHIEMIDSKYDLYLDTHTIA